MEPITMDLATVSVALSSVTALAAVIVPGICTYFTIRSQMKIKKMELYAPRVYDALAEMSAAYSQLSRNTDPKFGEYKEPDYTEASQKFHHFMSSCYRVMSLVPDEHIGLMITDLLNLITQAGFSSTAFTDPKFYQIMEAISKFIRTRKLRI